MRKLKIILDAAHGKNTPGKCSPDKTHFEWKWSREIVKRLAEELEKNSFEVDYSNKTDIEIGLTKRVQNTNKIEGKNNLFFSLHNNASRNDGRWGDATGVEIWTLPGRQLKSDYWATVIFYGLKSDFPELKFREDPSDGDPDKEAKLTVLTCKCPATLLEWGFQDTKSDLKWITNESYKRRLIESLVKSFIKIDETIS